MLVHLAGRRALLLAAAAAAVLALAASLFSAPSADAQAGVSLRPEASFERVDAGGAVLAGFYYAREPQLNIVRITMRPSDSENGDSVTYRDFGAIELFYEQPGEGMDPSMALHDGAAADRWVAPGGTALAACEAGANRCTINKAEWQALAGQADAADTVVMQPITVAFKVPASVVDAQPVIRVQAEHDTASAARPPSGSPSLPAHEDWKRVEPDKATPVALTRDGRAIDEFVFSNAAGNLGPNLQHVRISIGAGGIPGFGPRTYAAWGTAADAGLYISINDGMNPGTAISADQVPMTIFESDGRTPLCTTETSGGSCYLTKARYQELAGQPDAPDSAEIKPIRIAFKVPGATLNPDRDYLLNTAILNIARRGALGSDDNVIPGQNATATTYKRLIAQLFRLQSAAYDPVTETTTKLPNPVVDQPPAGSVHSAVPCEMGDGSEGSTTHDCYRHPEVGEAMRVAAIMLKGGEHTSDVQPFLNRTNSSWLEYGPEHFDEIRVFYRRPAVGNPGDAMLVSADLCPVTIPSEPEHPYADAPRDRTAEALRTCKWDRAFYGTRYRTLDNPGGSPYQGLDIGPLVIGTKGGSGKIEVQYRLGGVVVAWDDFTFAFLEPTAARLASHHGLSNITANLGRRSTDTGLTLQIGYYRHRGIPEHWGWETATAIGAPGYFGPARYEDIRSVELTVPAGGGTLELLGTGHYCTAARSACTLSLDPAALQAAARYGLPADKIGRALRGTDPIWPVQLAFHHAGTDDVEIKGVLTRSRPGGDPRPGEQFRFISYTAKASAAGAGPSVAGYLPGDADDILEAGQRAAVIIGYTLPVDDVWSEDDSDGTFSVYDSETEVDASAYMVDGARPGTFHVLPGRLTGEAVFLRTSLSDAEWRTYSPGGADFKINTADHIWLGAGEPPVSTRYSAVPDFLSVSGYTGNVAQLGPTHDRTTPLPSPNRGAYLLITGPASWDESGGSRMQIDRGDYGYVKCVAKDTLSGDPVDDDQDFCYVTDAAGNPPVLRVDADADAEVSVIANVPMWRQTSAVPAPTHHPLDFEAARNTDSVQRIDAFGSATFKVQAINQLASISLGRAPASSGIVPTRPIPINGSADLQLALLNENGAPSQLSSISAITVTVIGGGRLGGDHCPGSASCTIPASRGSLFEAAATKPSIIGEIGLTYEAPAEPGTAGIEATVVGRDGTTFTERIDLTISGSATEIAAGGELPRVHSSATEDDDRDVIRIAIGASDADGNAARMPTNAAATVRGIDGATAPSGRLTSEVKCTDAERLRCSIEIVVTASASSPLAAGAYTATVTGRGIGSTEVGFAVAGPAETVALAVPAVADLPGLAGSFTATATVTDKDGIPVADGTWVEFRTTAASGASSSAIVTRPVLSDHDGDADTDPVRRAQTKNGVAEGTVTVVANGIAILTATASGKSANEPIDTRETTVAAAAAGPPVQFSTGAGAAATGVLATWSSAEVGDARQALEQAPGASIVWLWNGLRWFRWGTTADGAPLPGSSPTPFVILPGDRLWFAN